MADEKEKQEFEDAALYGTEAGAVRVPGDVLFRVGPQFDEETVRAAREIFNPRAFIDAALALTGARSVAESFALGIQASIAQLHSQAALNFDARAAIMGAWPAELQQHTLAEAVEAFVRAAQANHGAAALAASQALQAHAEGIGRSVYNWTLGKDEGCEKQEQEKAKVQDLGTVG